MPSPTTPRELTLAKRLTRRRSFEDWIMEPRCRHSLSKLNSRIDSADAPAVTAKCVLGLLVGCSTLLFARVDSSGYRCR